MDNHGDIIENENKGRIQQAVDSWEKSAKTPSAFQPDINDSEPDKDLKDKIKKSINEINSAKEQNNTAVQSDTVTAEHSESINDEKPKNVELTAETPAYNLNFSNNQEFDIEDIANDQNDLFFSLIYRLAGCFICTCLLLLITVLPVLNVQSGFLNPQRSPLGYVLSNIILLLLTGIFGYTVAFKGIISLFTFKPDSDSIVSLGYFAALIGCVYSLYSYITANSAVISVYSSCAAVCLTLNLLGKIFFVARVRKNLPLITSMQNTNDEFYAAQVVKPVIAQEILKTFKGIPSIIKPLKVKNSNEFLEQSYAQTPADYVSRVLSPIVLAAALCTGALEFLLKGDASKAVMLFSAICCVSSPFLLEASVAVPLYRVSKRLIKKDAIVAGCDTVSEFGDADAIVADGSFIFPKGSIRICGVKTLAGHDINEAMLYAASISAAGKSPVAPAIMGIFGNIDPKLLKKCEKLIYEDEKGLYAVIGDRAVLFGNREILRHHLIEVPSRDFEIKNTSNGKHVLYLAADGEICAMFIVDFCSNVKSAAIIKKLQHYGIQLLIKSTDPNISPMLIEDKFNISASNVEMLGAEDIQLLTGSDAGSCHSDCIFKDIEGYTAAIISSIKLKGTLNDCNALQLLFSIFGILLVVFSAFAGGGISAVTPLSVLLYETICAIPVLLIIIFRKH